MSNRFSTIRWLAGAMIVMNLTALTAYQTHGDDAYLPGIGPAPLRFQPILVIGKLAVLPPLEMGDDAARPESTETTLSATNATTTVEPGTALDATNGVSTAATTEHSAANADSTATSITSAASYSSVLTPQMLTEYFRPLQGATNGAGVSFFIPAEVGFTPPNAQLSSQATYKTE